MYPAVRQIRPVSRIGTRLRISHSPKWLAQGLYKWGGCRRAIVSTRGGPGVDPAGLRGQPLTNLSHVVAQMVPVADDDRFQWTGSILANGAGDRVLRRWNARDHVRQMQVEMRPERHEVRPVGILITLRTDPLILFVTRKRQRLGLLGAHESLMVVCRGVNQVTKDFLRRPAARVRP